MNKTEAHSIARIAKMYPQDALQIYENFIDKYKKKHSPLYYGHGDVLGKISNAYYQKRAEVFERFVELYVLPREHFKPLEDRVMF